MNEIPIATIGISAALCIGLDALEDSLTYFYGKTHPSRVKDIVQIVRSVIICILVLLIMRC